MRGRAAWRARHDDPRAALGWALRDLGGPARTVAEGGELALGILAAVALFGGNWIGAATVAVFSQAPKAVLNGLAYLRGFRYLPRSHQFVPRSLPVGSLLTLPAPATPFPCGVEVGRGGTMLGKDVGIVTFVEGWLHFEGHRTSFALRRPDVSRRTDDALELSEGGELLFRPQDWLVAEGLEEAGLAARFRANLASWMRSDAPEGDSILPPAAAHLTGVVRARGNLLASLAFGTLLFAFVAWLSGTGWAALFVVPFLTKAVCAIRDVRRLGRRQVSLPVVE